MSNLSTMSVATDRSPSGVRFFDLQSNSMLAGIALGAAVSTEFIDEVGYRKPSTTPKAEKVATPNIRFIIDRSADIDAAVIQLWEGRVLDVDRQHDLMTVLLTAKKSQIPEHTAEIELQWVSEQDRDLVVPGAVFYLTLYKQTRHGSITNSQELRFRRRPSWTKQQIQRIYSEADSLLGKMQPCPQAE